VSNKTESILVKGGIGNECFIGSKIPLGNYCIHPGCKHFFDCDLANPLDVAEKHRLLQSPPPATSSFETRLPPDVSWYKRDPREGI